MMKHERRSGIWFIETIKRDWPLERWLLTEPGIDVFIAINRWLQRSRKATGCKSCSGEIHKGVNLFMIECRSDK